jgi:hypothetical protein
MSILKAACTDWTSYIEINRPNCLTLKRFAKKQGPNRFGRLIWILHKSRRQLRSEACSAFVRTYLACFAKRRERAYSSHRACHSCAVSSWEGEEFDKRPHTLFLTAARKSLGSC